jgi:ribonuclease Z
MLGTDNDSIVVTLLGTGTPGPRINRFGPSTLVEAGGLRLLFDCGRGTMQRIYQIDPDTSNFNKLFLTHLHSDHTTGIPDLWITREIFMRLSAENENSLRIWGPTGTKQMIKHFVKAFKVDKKVRNELRGIPHNSESFRIEANDVDEGFIYEENGVKVVPFRVNHHDLYSDEPSLGYRIEYKDRSVVLSGDTRYCENLIKYSENVDLLIHEVAAGPLGEDLPDRMRLPLGHHTLPEECGVIFSQVKPKLAVYNHIIQFQGVSLEEMMATTKKEYDGPVLFGEDLMKIEVGDSVKVLSSEVK